MAIWGRTAVVVGMFVLAWAFSGVAVEAQQNACNATSAQQCYTLYAPGQNGCWNDPSDWPVIMFYNVTKSQNSTAPLVLTANSTQSFALDNNATWNVVVEDETYQYPLACSIATTSSGWSYAGGCPGDPAACGGCQQFAAPSVDARGFHLGCVPDDPLNIQYHNVYLLDTKNGNLLFRGPKPIMQQSDGTYVFDYQRLMSILQRRYHQQIGASGFPTDFIFVDVSLIATGGLQQDYLTAEYARFGGTGTTPPAYHSYPPQNATAPLPAVEVNGTNATVRGQLWWWNIMPGADGASKSHLPELVRTLGALMQPNEVPRVIYLHCDAGDDRTGEAAISYLLGSRNFSFANAWVYGTTYFDTASSLAPDWMRHIPQPLNVQGALWYAKEMNATNIVEDNSSVPDTGPYPCPYPWGSDSTCKWGASAP